MSVPHLTLALILALLGCSPQSDAKSADVADVADVDVAAPVAVPGEHAPAGLGEGFAVWESNRGGPWRIWIRALDDGAPRRLTAGERGRAHCCPHVAPDGSQIAYLSLPVGQESYPATGSAGELRLIRPDGTGDRVLVPAARTYFEHRAVVWRDAGELIYIAGDGSTRLRDVESGADRTLLGARAEPHGWLVDPTLRHAALGNGTFARYDPETRTVIPGRALGGCQPYLSRDGRWGYWVAGAGGPIRARELDGGREITVLGKSDPRLPADRGYLYFPMLSADGTLLTFAASAGEHDHQRADYDVFVVEIDPGTLELIGTPIRLTDDPATDRFPDVYRAPLELGRHFGEAPFDVALSAPDGDSTWRWQLGDGTGATGARVAHTYRSAGVYAPRAVRGDRIVRGLVRSRPARPPEVVRTALADGGRRIVVHFDEPVELGAVEVELRPGGASGPAARVRAVGPGSDGRSLEIELTTPLESAAALRLAGVYDRARVANRMTDVTLELEPPRWPSEGRGLVFLWRSATAPNQVVDPAAGGPRPSRLEPHGRAWVDRDGAMVLRGGHFLADMPTMERVLAGVRSTNELTFEATIAPHRAHPGDLARIFTFSAGESSRNFTLAQAGDELILRLRVPENGPNADRPQIVLGKIPVGRPSHWLVSYTPGRLIAYRDGEKVRESEELLGGFYHWQPRPFLFGNEWQANHPWHGALEGIAIYNRVVDAEEARENAQRYRAERRARPEVPRLRLRARLVVRSRLPTQEEIAPYREALAVYEYAVEEVLEGDYAGERIRVVHRVLADGEELPAARRGPGDVVTLALEPFSDQTQLESLYLSETLPEDYSLELYYALEP